MDTALIADYYREIHPVKRANILARMIEEEGSSEENRIRQELYDVRYSKKSGSNANVPADGLLGLWMALEYNRDVGKGLFGGGKKRAVKDIRKKLSEIRIMDYIGKGGLYEELARKELAHMVRSYMMLCKTDKSYSSGIFGLVHMGEESVENKIRADIRTIALEVPAVLGLEEDLEPVTRAAREAYEEFFPYEGGL